MYDMQLKLKEMLYTQQERNVQYLVFEKEEVNGISDNSLK
jgi:hypothetical protein